MSMGIAVYVIVASTPNAKAVGRFCVAMWRMSFDVSSKSYTRLDIYRHYYTRLINIGSESVDTFLNTHQHIVQDRNEQGPGSLAQAQNERD